MGCKGSTERSSGEPVHNNSADEFSAAVTDCSTLPSEEHQALPRDVPLSPPLMYKAGRTSEDAITSPSQLEPAPPQLEAPPSTPPPLPPPTHSFQVLPQLIGTGGTASVYLGAMKELDNPAAKAIPVAVKTVDVTDARKRAVLEAEYATLRQLASCPYIVKVLYFDVDEASKKGRIFMELCRRGTLHALAKKQPQCRLHELHIRAYMRDCLRGLQFLHERGIIHRDAKNQNAMVGEVYVPMVDEGKVYAKVSDFGTCKATLHGICATTANVVGTVPYMSPEAIRGKFSEASDIWAWAVSFVELATPGLNVWAHLKCRDSYGLLLKIGMLQPPQHHPPLPAVLSDEALSLLERCFAYDWTQRPSAKALLCDAYFTMSDVEAVASLTGLESLEAFAAADKFEAAH